MPKKTPKFWISNLFKTYKTTLGNVDLSKKKNLKDKNNRGIRKKVKED